MDKIISTVSLKYRRVNEITRDLVPPKREYFCSICYSCKNMVKCPAQGQFIKSCSNWARIE